MASLLAQTPQRRGGFSHLLVTVILIAWGICQGCVAAAGDEVAVVSEKENEQQVISKTAPLDQLRSLRKSARTPAEKVAATEAWLKTHPQVVSARLANPARFAARIAELSSRPAPPKPTEEKASLKWEVRQGLNETLAQARSPKEAVALTDEFLKLNAVPLKEFAPRIPTLGERRARLFEILAKQSAKTGELTLKMEISTGLLATRAEARTPAEMVALTDQFLKLNAEAIAEANPSKLKKTSTAR